LKCDIALFQVEEAVELYLAGDPPDWLRKAMTHIGWIFESYPLTAAYLNLATEIMFDFVIGGEASIDDAELTELNYMRVSPNAVKKVLEESYLIETGDSKVYPGRLVDEISKLRLTEYNLKNDEFREKVQEVRGVLSVALTLALVRFGRFKPQRPLSLFRILAQNMLNSGLNDSADISRTLSEQSFEDACVAISARQKRRLKWHISGFSTGHPYVIENIDENMNIVFDVDIVTYMDRMRERYRERKRARVRGE
jgi:hypothetical protein